MATTKSGTMKSLRNTCSSLGLTVENLFDQLPQLDVSTLTNGVIFDLHQYHGRVKKRTGKYPWTWKKLREKICAVFRVEPETVSEGLFCKTVSGVKKAREKLIKQSKSQDIDAFLNQPFELVLSPAVAAWPTAEDGDGSTVGVTGVVPGVSLGGNWPRLSFQEEVLEEVNIKLAREIKALKDRISVLESEKVEMQDDPVVIIPNLCRILQEQGHMVGSSGAISMTRNGKSYFTPSGVLKEKIQPEDIFIHKNNTQFHGPPATKKLKRSANSTVFELIFDKTDADTIVHTHCLSSNLLTQITAGNEVRIRNQEMIKGIAKCKSGGMYKNTDELIIPIVENEPEEQDLEPALSKAIDDYPETCAVLVRNHGIYVWGKSWQKTKIMYECYCYLSDLMIKMKQLGIPRS